MIRTRVIPALLLRNGGLVKTVRFRNPKYIGDPINAVRIFNDKEVDELVFLDITATLEGRSPNYELIADIVSEAFMPFAYGGGIHDLEQIRRLFGLGVEKVVINSQAIEDPKFITAASDLAGSSSVVVSIDAKRDFLGRYEIVTHGATRRTGLDPAEFAKQAAAHGAGEILLNSVDRDGTQSGYDIALLRSVAQAVDVPVVACGGAGKLEDFRQAVREGHAAAVAAGSLFVFHGPHRAVLITYPEYNDLVSLFE